MSSSGRPYRRFRPPVRAVTTMAGVAHTAAMTAPLEKLVAPVTEPEPGSRRNGCTPVDTAGVVESGIEDLVSGQRSLRCRKC